MPRKKPNPQARKRRAAQKAKPTKQVTALPRTQAHPLARSVTSLSMEVGKA